MRRGRGRHSFLSREQKERQKSDLLASPETFGYNTANWSGPLLRNHLEATYHVVYRQAAVYVLLHELGFSFQRARGKYPERDETRRETVKADIKKL
jgi:transposase